VAEVEVADAHRVGIAEGPEAHLGGSPRAHEREDLQSRVGVRQGQVRALLHAGGVGRRDADCVPATALQPQRVVRVAGGALAASRAPAARAAPPGGGPTARPMGRALAARGDG
jgi:hypothetical protein